MWQKFCSLNFCRLSSFNFIYFATLSKLSEAWRVQRLNDTFDLHSDDFCFVLRLPPQLIECDIQRNQRTALPSALTSTLPASSSSRKTLVVGRDKLDGRATTSLSGCRRFHTRQERRKRFYSPDLTACGGSYFGICSISST